MNLSSISINRPVLAIVMSLVIMLFGGIGYTFLGVREFPSIDPPVITVRTNYTGANADVVESRPSMVLQGCVPFHLQVTLAQVPSQSNSTLMLTSKLQQMMCATRYRRQ
jgi:multidrug efflux pump subunit AcrB